jgi:hypothetical protein
MCCSCKAAVKAQSACSFWACLKNHSFGDGSTHSRSDGGPSGSQAVTASGVRCLQAIAQVLQVSVSFFFEEANPSGGESAKLAAIAEALRTKQGVRIAIALARIRNNNVRRRLANLLESIMQDEDALSPIND